MFANRSSGPLRVGFDYFFDVPHVSQFPHVFIENQRVVGLKPDDDVRPALFRRELGNRK